MADCLAQTTHQTLCCGCTVVCRVLIAAVAWQAVVQQVVLVQAAVVGPRILAHPLQLLC